MPRHTIWLTQDAQDAITAYQAALERAGVHYTFSATVSALVQLGKAVGLTRLRETRG